jgi:hypothetical protein
MFLQGVTLDEWMSLGLLDRYGFSEQSLYVAASRVKLMSRLILSEPLTWEYVQKFRPPLNVLLVMKKILDRLDKPAFMDEEQYKNFY